MFIIESTNTREKDAGQTKPEDDKNEYYLYNILVWLNLSTNSSADYCQ